MQAYPSSPWRHVPTTTWELAEEAPRRHVAKATQGLGPSELHHLGSGAIRGLGAKGT